MKETICRSYYQVLFHKNLNILNQKKINLFICLLIITILVLIYLFLNYHVNTQRVFISVMKLKNPTRTNQKCKYEPQGPRILCCVITHYGNLETKAVAIKNTWGK